MGCQTHSGLWRRHSFGDPRREMCTLPPFKNSQSAASCFHKLLTRRQVYYRTSIWATLNMSEGGAANHLPPSHPAPCTLYSQTNYLLQVFYCFHKSPLCSSLRPPGVTCVSLYRHIHPPPHPTSKSLLPLPPKHALPWESAHIDALTHCDTCHL